MARGGDRWWRRRVTLGPVASDRRGVSDNAAMSAAKDCKISGRGRLTVPAELRRRWGLVDGGEVSFIDLGNAAVIVPAGAAAARAELRRGWARGDRRCRRGRAGSAAFIDCTLTCIGVHLGCAQDDDRERGPSGLTGDP
ncbi:MAG: AbrB/MazE/SpoVT family DNA-binding domain-containing protein [Acidimicrobiales bacterium]